MVDMATRHIRKATRGMAMMTCLHLTMVTTCRHQAKAKWR